MAPYLTLMTEDAPQRKYSLREVFNGLRYIVHTGMQWRMMPNDLPPWPVVYQQMQRWLKAGVFGEIVRDLRMLLREIADRAPQPRALTDLGRTACCSRRRSGARMGYDGHKRRKGSKVLHGGGYAGPVVGRDRDAGERTGARSSGRVGGPGTGGDRSSVEIAFVDQGYTGELAAEDAAAHGIRLEVVKLPADMGSCCCHAVGSSSVASPGWRASGAWHATLKGETTGRAAFRGLHRSCFCVGSSPSWSKVHNTL